MVNLKIVNLKIVHFNILNPERKESLSLNEPNIIYAWWEKKSERRVEELFPLSKYLIEFLFHSLFYTTHFASVIDGIPYLLCLHCRSESLTIQKQLVEIQIHNHKELVGLGDKINKQYRGISIPTVMRVSNKYGKIIIRCVPQDKNSLGWGTSPELCALFLIGKTLNISFLLNTPWYESMKSENSPLLIRLDYTADGVEQQEEVYSNLVYRGVILDTFCKTQIPHKLKVFIYTNRTSLSLSTALLSPCEKNIWLILITVTIVVCCVMNYVAWKTREHNSFTNVEITFYALSVSLGQYNSCFESKCSLRSFVLSTVYSLWTFFMLAFSMHYSGYFLAYLLVRTLPEVPNDLNDFLANSKFENIPLFSTGFITKRVDDNGTYRSYLQNEVLLPRSLYYSRNNFSVLSSTYTNLALRVIEHMSISEQTFSEHEFFYNLTFDPRRMKFEFPLEEVGIYAFLDPLTTLEKYENLAIASKSYESVVELKLRKENSIDIDPYGKTFYYQKGLCSFSIHKIVSLLDNSGLFRQWKNQHDYLKNLESLRKWSILVEKNKFSRDLLFLEIPPLNSETLQEIIKLCGILMLASLVSFILENSLRIFRTHISIVFIMSFERGMLELMSRVKEYLNGYSTNRY